MTDRFSERDARWQKPDPQTPRTGRTPSVLPRPDFHFPGEVGRTYLDSDPAQFPKPVQAPEGIAEGRLERTIPIQFSLGEGLDICRDTGSPSDFTYKPPFAFTGKIEKVTIELKLQRPAKQQRHNITNKA